MARRRGHNEGSVYERADGRWEAIVSLGDGRRKSYYAKTRAEAARKLTAALRDRDRGLSIMRDERLTVEQYLTSWLERVAPTIGEGTHMRYTEMLRCHVLPTLGRVALTKLSPLQVETLYATLLSDGGKSGAGLSPTTVRQLHAILHHALKDALRKGLILRNITDMVDAPRRARYEAATLSADEAQMLLDSEVARTHRLYALFVLVLYTGMREGEMLALKWRDVDLDQGVVEVRATLSRGRTGIRRGDTKTDAGRRLIPLLAPAVAALHEHRTRQLQERIAAGPVWRDQGLVFTSATGGMLTGYNVLRREWYPLLAGLGLRRIRLHDARHSTATLLTRAGVHPKIISALLGHSSIKVTMDTYAHASTEMIREGIAPLERLLGGNGFSDVLPSVLPSTRLS